ncbi:vacuolar ATPase proteolipid subunit [Cavenderia fasciculata]|uniref:V-type proton ATPase proteolipid subunit n=1 Tax=Cavenderia fasciculata TaxID=261658 RepID=F4PSX5_CACFS|nr:vacuolar ATPase proteolipid subunit [Cavenderia fasciculata]EGG20764.1 vacuolar ATPase proteolipid subunit [Cavenderia fasciculata]|eukprot:XP_004358614.1 vacuolar ATPase proteolipid subunit [Cavenderia fasciculata]
MIQLFALLAAAAGRLITEACPIYAPFFGAMGVTSALVFTVMGAAYGTAKSSVGISTMGVMKPDLVIRAFIPVIFAGVIAIYGLIICVIIVGNLGKTTANYTLYKSFTDLAAGLTVGLCGLAAGMAIGIVGDSGVRAFGQQAKLYVIMMLILIFSEALGLYGLIIGILLSGVKDDYCPGTPLAPPAAQ